MEKYSFSISFISTLGLLKIKRKESNVFIASVVASKSLESKVILQMNNKIILRELILPRIWHNCKL